MVAWSANSKELVNFSREGQEAEYYGQQPAPSFEADEKGEDGDEDNGDNSDDAEGIGGDAEDADWDDATFSNEPGVKPDPKLMRTNSQRIAARKRKEEKRHAKYDAELYVDKPMPAYLDNMWKSMEVETSRPGSRASPTAVGPAPVEDPGVICDGCSVGKWCSWYQEQERLGNTVGPEDHRIRIFEGGRCPCCDHDGS